MENVYNFDNEPQLRKIEVSQEIELGHRFGVSISSMGYLDAILERTYALEDSLKTKGLLSYVKSATAGVKFLRAYIHDDFQVVPFFAMRHGYSFEFDKVKMVLWCNPPKPQPTIRG